MLSLTRHGLLGRLHHQIETDGAARSMAINVTAAAIGLAAGRSTTVQKTPPLAVIGGGLALSFLGMSGVGDGMASAGATVLGYRLGSRGRLRRQEEPVASVPASAPTRRRA